MYFKNAYVYYLCSGMAARYTSREFNRTRPRVTGLSEITQMSAVLALNTRELPLDCIKATGYTALDPIIRVQEIIKLD